jgi:hypothetical protein
MLMRISLTEPAALPSKDEARRIDYFVSLAKKRATERALMSGLVRSMTSGRIPFGMQQPI